MKTITKLFTLALLTGLFITSKANASGYLNVYSLENSSKIQLELIRPTSEAIDFYVADSRNRQIHTERIPGTSEFNQVIDLSKLKNGRYTLVTKVANQKSIKVVKVKNGTLEEIDNYYTFEPAFKLEDNSLHINHIDDGSDYVSIEIEDRNGIIYEAGFNKDVIFAETLSLDNLEDGYYTLNLLSGRDNFSFDFEISR